VLLYALLHKWSSVQFIVSALNSQAREVIGATGPVRAQWPHWDLYDAHQFQLLTYLLGAVDMPLIFDIPDADVRQFCHEHATAKQRKCAVWNGAVPEVGGAPMAVVQPGWGEAAFEGELGAGDMLGLKHHALHAGPALEAGIERRLAVVVKSIAPTPATKLQPEQLDASDALESIGAAGMARAYRSSLGPMLTDKDVLRRVRNRTQSEVVWDANHRLLLANEGCTEADVQQLAAVAAKKRAERCSWGE
jgi:hypothetical protein